MRQADIPTEPAEGAQEDPPTFVEMIRVRLLRKTTAWTGALILPDSSSPPVQSPTDLTRIRESSRVDEHDAARGEHMTSTVEC
jgi:hypothetical protein